MMRHALLAALLFTSSVPVVAKPMAPSPAISAAVANKDRPADAIALDANRKPAEVLSFMQLKPGMATIDVITGSGYYAELMARAVGAKGSVVAYSPQAFYARAKDKIDAMLARETNAHLQTDLRVALTPATYDFAMIHLNYHDFYWESEQFKVPRTDPNAVLALLFKAMKPGGVVAVVDHVGPAGDTRAIVDKLHRIDPATVKADFERAGFKLEASSNLLADPTDDHSKNVFDPAIRGKTDRFTYRFRKPK